jgi:hypothetical protein
LRKNERCEAIRSNLVDEIWTVYVKRCKSEPGPLDENDKKQAAPPESVDTSQSESQGSG